MLTPSELVEFETAPGSNSGFPAHRYAASGASIDEIRELFARHQALPVDEQVKFNDNLRQQSNSFVEAQIVAVRAAVKAGDVSETAPVEGDREFTGSIDDVLSKVGDDQAAAQRAMAEEQAQANPRKRLVEELSKKVLPPAATETANSGSPGA